MSMGSDALGPNLGDLADGVRQDMIDEFFDANKATMDALDATKEAIAGADSAEVILKAGIRAMESVLSLVKARLAAL